MRGHFLLLVLNLRGYPIIMKKTLGEYYKHVQRDPHECYLNDFQELVER
jgi:hypothetical protein